MDYPSKVLEQAEQVREAFHTLADDRSRREYVDQIAWRLTGNPECLGPKDVSPQYLPSDIVRPMPDEVIVDCGAYDGDTLESWLHERGPDFARWVALEPDPGSRGRLERYVASLPDEIRDRVTVVPFAVGSREERVSFTASGTASSYVGAADSEGDSADSVRSLPLDDLCRELDLPPVTFLKMDVEGAEPDAIAGAVNVIGSGRALLALSVYHVQDHLWRIPLTVRRLRPDLQLSLRPHNEQGWDLVLYAVPPDRAV
jgi:FkbM family methyltransferase